jgi:hypothetical protein
VKPEFYRKACKRGNDSEGHSKIVRDLVGSQSYTPYPLGLELPSRMELVILNTQEFAEIQRSADSLQSANSDLLDLKT